MVSREHENKDVGCRRTTVTHVWAEIAETFSVPRRSQSNQLLISNNLFLACLQLPFKLCCSLVFT